jgi:hypothetical protein
MLSRNNQGEVIGEINTSFTDKGENRHEHDLQQRTSGRSEHFCPRQRRESSYNEPHRWETFALIPILRPSSQEKTRGAYANRRAATNHRRGTT